MKFDYVPVTCPTQERYHAIAPCLAEMMAPAERAASLNIGYSTITRWLREFRENGMRGLFPTTEFPREPYTPERVIVTLLYFKCCVPKAGDRELVRVVTTATGHQLRKLRRLTIDCCKGGLLSDFFIETVSGIRYQQDRSRDFLDHRIAVDDRGIVGLLAARPSCGACGSFSCAARRVICMRNAELKDLSGR